MDDLGRAMAGAHGPMRMLGGGNPAHIPEMQAIWRDRMAAILADPAGFDRMMANYDPPIGNARFIAALAKLLRQEFGWNLGPENIAITAGGQTAFFFSSTSWLVNSPTEGERPSCLRSFPNISAT